MTNLSIISFTPGGRSAAIAGSALNGRLRVNRIGGLTARHRARVVVRKLWQSASNGGRNRVRGRGRVSRNINARQFVGSPWW